MNEKLNIELIDQVHEISYYLKFLLTSHTETDYQTGNDMNVADVISASSYRISSSIDNLTTAIEYLHKEIREKG